MTRDLFLDSDSGIPNANPMGPLAGVKPSEIVGIETGTLPVDSGRVRVKIRFTSSDALPTYAQLAAWASAQAQRCERVYPERLVSDFRNEYTAVFIPALPDGNGICRIRCRLTREQAIDLFRNGLPRHEVFPDV